MSAAAPEPGSDAMCKCGHKRFAHGTYVDQCWDDGPDGVCRCLGFHHATDEQEDSER